MHAESRAVVLTAIPVEYLAVREQLSQLHEVRHPRGTVYEVGTFASDGCHWRVLIVEIGASGEAAALEAERAIAYFDPQAALFVGVAGGLKDVVLGDVVAATDVFGYEAGKARLQFEPRASVAKSTYGMQSRARAEGRKQAWFERIKGAHPTTMPRVLVAPIAAGAKVVADTRSAIYKFLRRNYGHAVAVEMEGLGFLRAAEANQQVDALVVRGISDLIDDKSETDATGFQLQAARHAAAFAFSVLSKHTALALEDVRAPEFAEKDPDALKLFGRQEGIREQPSPTAAGRNAAPLSPGISPETVRGFIDSFRKSYQPYEAKLGVLVDPREVYVPLRCKPQQSNASAATDALDWLRAGISEGQALIVLSDYGSGKSFLALELQRRLAEEFFAQPETGPIPVVFPLKLHRSTAILDDLCSFLNRYGLPIQDQDELLARLRSGRLVVILDAIDEIPLVQTVEPDMMAGVLERLDLRQFGPIPWVATSRTGLFAAVLPVLKESRTYRVAYLQEWDAGQWLRYVHLSDKDSRIFETKEERDSFLLTVDRSPRLRGLTATPLFARMLIESWPAIRHKPTDLNRVQLYRHYVDYVFRAKQQESLLPDLERRRQCLESAAVHFFRSNISSCSSDEILAIADSYVRDIGRHELAGFVRIELQTYSLLVCDPSTGALGFSHKSFYEYFLALAVLRELQAERFTPVGKLLQMGLDQGEAAFVAELLAEEAQGVLRYELEHLLLRDNSLYRPTFRRNLVLLTIALARAVNQERATGEPPYSPLAGANLANSALSGLDFSNLSLKGADLRGVIADGTSFARADMRGCNLKGAKLIGCNLCGADLRDASLEYSVIARIVGTDPPPRLAGAKLSGITTRRHDATYLKYAAESDEEADEAWRTRTLRAIRRGTIDDVADQ